MPRVYPGSAQAVYETRHVDVWSVVALSMPNCLHGALYSRVSLHDPGFSRGERTSILTCRGEYGTRSPGRSGSERVAMMVTWRWPSGSSPQWICSLLRQAMYKYIDPSLRLHKGRAQNQLDLVIATLASFVGSSRVLLVVNPLGCAMFEKKYRSRSSAVLSVARCEMPDHWDASRQSMRRIALGGAIFRRLP